MKSIFKTSMIAALLFGAAHISNAQVKIGTNPTAIEANSNLEVEASTAGRKVKVDKTSGQVTIADGTQDTGKILTSDVNGGASWQTPLAQNSEVMLSVVIGTQQVTTSSQLLDFTSAKFDKNSNFNLTTNEFVAPSPGYYHVNLHVISNTAAGAATGRYALLYLNGALDRALYNDRVEESSGYSVYSGAFLKLNAGDKLSIMVGTAGGSPAYPITNGYFDVIKVSN
jgi:hypothetical protein